MSGTTISTRRGVLLLATLTAALVSAACGGSDRASTPEQGSELAMDGMADMPGMAPGMAGMDGMSHGPAASDDAGMGDATLDRLVTQLNAMQGMHGDSLHIMMLAHRQAVANGIAQMNREMRDMNMTADATWNATVDSLRRDLVQLPTLTEGELPAFMPAHRVRALRLLELHRTMMQGMRP